MNLIFQKCEKGKMSDVGEVYPTQRVVICDVCGSTEDIQWFCKNCPGSLCHICKESHAKTGISRKHLVVPRTETVVRSHGPAKIAEECQKHRGKEITVYCKRCKVPCCVKCHAENHKLHDFCPIDEAYLHAEKGLNVYIKQLEATVLPELDVLEQEAKREDSAYEGSVDKAIKHVSVTRKEAKIAVDSTCDALIDELRKPKSDQHKFLIDVHKQKQNIQELIQGCKNKIWEGKLDLIEYKPPSVDSLIPKCPSVPVLTPHFVPSSGGLDTIRQGIGQISYNEKFQHRETKHIVEEFDEAFLQTKKLHVFKCAIDARTIIQEGKSNAWISGYSSDSLYKYNKEGKEIKCIEVLKDARIRDFVVKHQGDFIVSNDDKKVRQVSVNGAVTTLIDTSPFDVFGVRLIDKDQIAVCMRIAIADDRNHIAIYSPDGRQKVSDIKARDANNENLLIYPYRVVQNGEAFTVVNVDSNVVTVDQIGNVKWVYDGKQAKLGKRFSPNGIWKDKCHNLLVCD